MVLKVVLILAVILALTIGAHLLFYKAERQNHRAAIREYRESMRFKALKNYR